MNERRRERSNKKKKKKRTEELAQDERGAKAKNKKSVANSKSLEPDTVEVLININITNITQSIRHRSLLSVPDIYISPTTWALLCCCTFFCFSLCLCWTVRCHEDHLMLLPPLFGRPLVTLHTRFSRTMCECCTSAHLHISSQFTLPLPLTLGRDTTHQNAICAWSPRTWWVTKIFSLALTLEP